ncbi:MAG: VOC family protein [Acidobacteriota bacterium]|nr:VOC family protein [Acidobacteriota bacterium]MDQ7087251.1 VOC family protein [Acidobacteriota bacterium]
MKGRVLGVAHLGVAVKDPRQRLGLWADLLGLPLERSEAVASEGVRTWFLDAAGVHVELLEPLDEKGALARHLERRGEGLHHLCLATDDLEALLARLAAAGLEPLPPGIREGAGGCRVAFLHPRDTGGVLLELSEKPRLEGKKHEEGEDPFGTGTLVVAYLREPRERVVGVIRSKSADGLAIEGLDLDAWEDWVNQWARGEKGPLAPSLQFFPASRIDKLLADRDTADLPSLQRRFEERTHRRLAEGLPGVRERE